MEAWKWAALGGFAIGYFAAAFYAIEALRVSKWLVIPVSMFGGVALGAATGYATSQCYHDDAWLAGRAQRPVFM